MICGKCGNWMEPNAEFCSYCRNRVEKSAAEGESSEYFSEAGALDGTPSKPIKARKSVSSKRTAAEKYAEMKKSAKSTLLFAGIIIGMIVVALIVACVLMLYKGVFPFQKEAKDETESSLYSDVQIGDEILFGSYEQDNDITNGKEEIKWIVLDKQDGKMLVISRDILDCQRYHLSQMEITWEHCSLRMWLNNSFLNSAFSEEEQSQLLSETIPADTNTFFVSDPGNSTADKVFLLSVEEAERYFGSGEERKCTSTDFAVSKAVRWFREDSFGSWWLRSPGSSSFSAAYVDPKGELYYWGNTFEFDGGVRPALWIKTTP